jgi:cytochrome c oxidase subunit IV
MSSAPDATGTSIHPTESVNVRHGVHPGPRQYVAIAVVLAIITGLEVTVYYLPPLQAVLVPVLLVLSITKFSLVALWFMHLKFDSRLFSAMFIVGILVAVIVFVVVLTMLRVFFA